MRMRPRRPQSHHTCRETRRALQPRQRGSALPIGTLGPAFLPTCRLPAGTDRPAEPPHPQQPHTSHAPAGRRSPTKPTLHRASIDATRPVNASRFGPGTNLTGPCPAALRAPTCRLHSSPFLAPKRRQPDAICRKSQARVRAGARKVAEGGGKCRLCVPHRYG